MKTHDLSSTHLVRRFGPRGARVFGRIWFFFVYAGLIGLCTTFCISVGKFTDNQSRLYMGLLASSLIVIATSLLTKMRLEYWASVERLSDVPQDTK